jgi:chemotaxis protein MotB
MRVIAGSFLLGIGLTSCVSQSSYDAVLADNTRLQAENAQLQRDVASQSGELSQRQGEIGRLQGAVKYTIESDLLFAPGSWRMSKEGKETLGRMATKLAPTQQNKLVVHGYTDNTPIGDELAQEGVPTNEALSQKRAEAVKQFLIERGVRPDLITVVGHGASNPVASNETRQGRQKNRRVELTLGG